MIHQCLEEEKEKLICELRHTEHHLKCLEEDNKNLRDEVKSDDVNIDLEKQIERLKDEINKVIDSKFNTDKLINIIKEKINDGLDRNSFWWNSKNMYVSWQKVRRDKINDVINNIYIPISLKKEINKIFDDFQQTVTK